MNQFPSLSAEMEARLQRTHPVTRNLFFHLIGVLKPFCDRHYSTHVPDYRFFKRFVFCELVPMIAVPVVRVTLRCDSVHIASSILKLINFNMKTSGRPGTLWVHFDVSDTQERIDECVRLVQKVSYENIELR